MKKLLFAAFAAISTASASAACVNWRITDWDYSSVLGQGSVTDLTRYSFKGRDLKLVFALTDDAATMSNFASRSAQYSGGEKLFTVVDDTDGLGVQVKGGNYGSMAAPLLVSDAKHCVRILLWENDGYSPDIPLCGKCEPIPEPTAAYLALLSLSILALRRK